ncbi:MAG: hypothetical protein FP831_10245 [Anaerolineae bacterium]|nr:hypothetical protein [Anaerolineae bacterium]
MRHWVLRLEDQREDVIQLVGESVYRIWRLYMSFCALGLKSGQTNINQHLVAKPVIGRVNLPMSRAYPYK